MKIKSKKLDNEVKKSKMRKYNSKKGSFFGLDYGNIAKKNCKNINKFAIYIMMHISA